LKRACTKVMMYGGSRKKCINPSTALFLSLLILVLEEI
jgi:hypothetical protein